MQPDDRSKDKSRQGYATVRAIDPMDGGEWDLLISHEKMDWVASCGMGAAKELAITVRQGLLKPRAIFQGVRDIKHEIEEDHWLCYVATPARAFDRKTGIEVPAWKDEVFLIFVTDERVVYLWYWDRCDPAKRHLPCDFESRFQKQLL